MLPSLLVAVAVTAPAAPVPKDTVPNPTGPAPRVVSVKAGADGMIWVTAQVYRMQKFQHQVPAGVDKDGNQIFKQQEFEQLTSEYIHKSLGDFGGKFVTADGTELTTESAGRRVKDGATLLVTADGKPVDKAWLKAVAGDTVIMTAEGLGEAHFISGHAPYPSTASPRLVVLGTDDKGEVRLPVNPNPPHPNAAVNRALIRGRKVAVPDDVAVAAVDGFDPPQPVVIPPGPDGKKALADIKFEAYDVAGKLVPKSEALDRLKAGGMVVVASDNRFPDADYLQKFRDDLLVIVSPELAYQPGQKNPFDGAIGKPATAGANPGKPAAAPAQGVPVIRVAAPPAAVIRRVQVQVEK